MDNIPYINMDKIDFNNVFLHYTNVNNIDNIFKNGLEPRIGENSKGLEKSKKVFFTIVINVYVILWMYG